MTVNGIAVRLIKEAEGLRLYVYDDATGRPVKAGDTLIGHPSIGYGRNLAARGCHVSEVNDMLRADVGSATVAAHQFLPTRFQQLSDARQAVLIDMAHNLGPTGLMGFRRMRAALEALDYELAAAEMMESAYAQQVPDRAERNARIMRTGPVA